MNLIHYLLKIMSKLEKQHRKTIVNYTIEAIRTFGNYRTIAENLSYFIQNISISPKYEIKWKALNKLAIAFKHLDLGNSCISDGPNERVTLYEDCKDRFEEADYFDVHEKSIEEYFEKARDDTIVLNKTASGVDRDVNMSNHVESTFLKRDSNFTMVEKVKGPCSNPMYPKPLEIVKHKSTNRDSQEIQSPLCVFIERKQKSNTIPHPPQISNVVEENLEEDEVSDDDKIEIKKRTFEIEFTTEQFNYFIIPGSRCKS